MDGASSLPALSDLGGSGPVDDLRSVDARRLRAASVVPLMMGEAECCGCGCDGSCSGSCCGCCGDLLDEDAAVASGKLMRYSLGQALDEWAARIGLVSVNMQRLK